MAKFKWYGETQLSAIEKAYNRRVKSACRYLSSAVKADISQAGTLRYNPTTKSGRPSKSQKAIYNFTHSAPGNPPFSQTKHLRRSIAWELVGKVGFKFVGRVGTNLKYGRWLELGTRRMKARPYLRRALSLHRSILARILTAKLKPGELPAIRSNQSRSGILGSGARKAGF